MILVGLDDTDVPGSRGTGRLAREIAAALATSLRVAGVVRHQLLVHPRVPYTAKNSAASILIADEADPDALFEQVRALMLGDFYPGSDPGLCVAVSVGEAVLDFGQRAKHKVLTQRQARAVAAEAGVRLAGLGGTHAGIIGALAAVGLAACGEDGRYIDVGRSRMVRGTVSVAQIRAAGIAAVRTRTGDPVEDGLIEVDRLRPARRGGQPVIIVDPVDGSDRWRALKLD
ncbi:MAG: ABC transporter substrate-binding protein [Chloroflexi bacterium]|nr:ABC transporter substrate-binding protein [Chloroflexota bacterium]